MDSNKNGEAMKNFCRQDLIRIVDTFEDKPEALNYMTHLLADSGCLNFPDRFLAAVRGREDIMSTGIGKGIAIPHARDLTVNSLQMAVCLLRNPMDFSSIDNLPVSLIFMIAAPQSSNQQYMQILRSLSEYLRDEDHRNNMINSENEIKLYEYICEIEDIIISNIVD